MHTMKGLSTSVGAHRMSHVAKTAERALKAGGRDIEDRALRASFRASTVVTNNVVLGVIGGLKRELAGG